MSNHPTVEAAAQAIWADVDGMGAPEDWPTEREDHKGPRRDAARVAVVAAFRERAEHLMATCQNPDTEFYPDGDDVARLLTQWADEIEGDSDGG